MCVSGNSGLPSNNPDPVVFKEFVIKNENGENQFTINIIYTSLEKDLQSYPQLFQRQLPESTDLFMPNYIK